MSHARGSDLQSLSPFLCCCKRSDTKYKFLESVRKKEVEEPCSEVIKGNSLPFACGLMCYCVLAKLE